MLRRTIALVITALAAATSAGCGDTDSWVLPRAASGWAAQYADAANSSFSPVQGATELRLDWIRSVKGELGAQVALGADGYLAVNAQTASGCSLMVWENDNRARQRWCTRTVQGGGFASPLLDGFDNLYVGQPGLVQSFPTTQWVRWRRPVIGMPMTIRMLDAGNLLVVTHLGQVLVFDAHRGTVVGTSLDLLSGVDPTDSRRGLDDCRTGGRECPVGAAPAYSQTSGIIVVPLWESDADQPVLIGLRYRPGESPLLSREWTSDAVGGGPLASPVLSADGATAYVNGRDERLWAIDTADGSAKWSVPLDYLAQTPPSVAPGGLIIAGGGPGAELVAIRDTAEEGQEVWRRDDVSPLSTSSLAGVGYTVLADPAPEGADRPDAMALAVFDLGDGHTINRYPLPNATGWPVGVSVGVGGRVVTADSDGRVYGFAPS